jgi:hypothetical protein
MKTVAALVRARSASFWIDVLAGRTPRASREVRVRGSRRSCGRGKERVVLAGVLKMYQVKKGITGGVGLDMSLSFCQGQSSIRLCRR